MRKAIRCLLLSTIAAVSITDVEMTAVGQSSGGQSAIAGPVMFLAKATPPAAAAATAIPALIRFSSVLPRQSGKASGDEASVTFLIFKDEKNGEPIWTETQMVPFDAAGRYEVYLGATTGSGLPSELFTSGEARWLEVQQAGAAPEPRNLLTSVPYALKAADAATLGGLPASAYALASSVASAANNTVKSESASSSVTTPGGSAGYLPVYSGATTLDDSIVFESGTNLGINTKTPASTLDVNGSLTARGSVEIQNTGTASASAGKNSHSIDLYGSVYNSSTKKITSPEFSLQTEAKGNNTSSAGATLNFLYGNGAAPIETGLSISSTGVIKFAPGQTFPSTSTTGTGLSGSSTSGIGVKGISYSDFGVQGISITGTGVQGVSSSSYGVEGTSTSGPGMIGFTAGTTSNTGGVVGEAGGTSGFGGIAGVWGDSASHIGVLGTSQHYAGVQGQSSISNGVLGTTAGNTLHTAGVFGTAGNGTSFNGIAGVWGDADAHVGVFGSSNQYSGVYGASTSSSGVMGTSSSGPGGQFTSTYGFAGQFSNSSPSATIYAANSTPNGGSALNGIATGSYGTAINASETGVDGTGLEAFGNGNGVIGVSSGQVIQTAGVLGVAGSRTAVRGIAGVWGDAQEHVGVIGSSQDYSGVFGTSTNSYGVQGSSANSAGVYGFSNGVGVHGVGGATTNPNVPNVGGIIGVWGDVSGTQGLDEAYAVVGSGNDSVSGYYTNNSSYYATILVTNYGGGDGVDQNPAARRSVANDGVPAKIAKPDAKTLELLSPGGSCNFGGKGDMACTGNLKSLATMDAGTKTVETYTMQSPENWMEDFGSGTVQNGVGKVTLDAAFAQTITEGADYHVFLTPRGDSRGLYVANATPTGFEVHESGGGTATLSFDYRIVAKRRGFESKRLADVTEEMATQRARFNKGKPIYAAAKK